MKKTLKIIAFLCVFAMFLALFGCDKKTTPYENTSFSMGSVTSQVIYGTSDYVTTAQNVNTQLNQLESKISAKIDTSQISQINSNSGKYAIKIDEQTFTYLQLAYEISNKTEGKFSVNILPLTRLWDFDYNTKVIPNDSDIKKLLPYIDYKLLQLDKNTITAYLTDENCGIDLGSIGKGAGCDVAIDEYKKDSTITGAIVSVGGSVGCIGTKNGEEKGFKIGVRNPNGSQNDSLLYFYLKNGFVSTSGTYEKEFTVDNKRYHHILDTKTGYPCDSDLLSATIICENGALSDALSTACLSIGYEKSIQLLKEYNAKAILIDYNKNVYISNEIEYVSLDDSYKFNSLKAND